MEAEDNAFGAAAAKLLRKPITKKAIESTTEHVRPRVKDDIKVFHGSKGGGKTVRQKAGR